MIFRIAFPFSLSILFGLTALYVAIARRHRPAWRVGVVLLLACMEITLAYTLREVSTDLSAKVFWYKLSLVGFAISATSFYSLAIQYNKSKNQIEPRVLLLLSVIPVLSSVSILTNEFHGLIWDPLKTPQIVNTQLFPSANEAGIGYWLFVAYSFFIIGLGCFTLIQWIVYSHGFYSRQALGVVIAAILALLGSALDIIHISPFPPFLATATGLAVGTISVVYALIPLRRHDVLAVSRAAIIEHIDECVIVVDTDEKIALVNPAAEKLVGHPNSFVVGKPLNQILPSLGTIPVYSPNQHREVILSLDNERQTFSLRTSSVSDWSGKVTCHIIVLHDITESKKADEKLLRSEANLAEAQRISHVGSWQWNMKEDQILLSIEMCRILGRLPQNDEITPEEFNQHLDPDEADEMLRRIRRNTSYPTINFEHVILRTDGQIRHVHSRIKVYRDEFGNPIRLLSSTQDITERKQAEVQMQIRVTALESAANGILISDIQGSILWANPSIERITGYSTAEIIEGAISLFEFGSLNPNISREIRASTNQKKSWNGVVVSNHKNGTEYIADMTITPVLNNKHEVTHYISIFQDITEKMETQKQLEYMATHDSLTRLPNRLLFSDRLGHALKVAKRAGNNGAILFIDLDDFKRVNDIFSHATGDELLQVLAKRLQGALRESDTIARIGGDEFAILLDSIEQFNVELVAQKIIQTVSEPVVIRNNTIVITTSIGISLFPQDGESIPVLMKNADLAMYQAKAQHKNSYAYFNQKMVDKIQNEMELVDYLRYAMKNNILDLYYQPQVDSETGAVVGVEALLRLPHPTRGWIAPGEFIPLAEKSDLILLIDEWVINTACRKKREMLDAGTPDFNLSLNISIRQLSKKDLIPLIRNAINKYDLNPENLEIEIGESSAFQNVEITIKALKDLKTLGIKLALDDFGKGYSSLNYLANFPLDILKIDLSFAQRVPHSTSDVGIVKGIIAIAQSLGLSVIVEGVEKREQLEFFISSGCKLIQGNYYSPAIHEKELTTILHNGFKVPPNSADPVN